MTTNVLNFGVLEGSHVEMCREAPGAILSPESPSGMLVNLVECMFRVPGVLHTPIHDF
jgi:hypothetical protein